MTPREVVISLLPVLAAHPISRRIGPNRIRPGELLTVSAGRHPDEMTVTLVNAFGQRVQSFTVLVTNGR